MMNLLSTLVALQGVTTAAAQNKTTGPFATAHATFNYSKLDYTDRGIEAVYPVAGPDVKFPVISYAHGFTDGGEHVMGHYSEMLHEMASYGYVIVAPRSCDEGCEGDCKSLFFDPPCFGHFYRQQLMTIDWARSPEAAKHLPINASLVGVAGHSMGGQATLFSAAYNATDYGIKAAVLHHAYTHRFPAITSIPHLVFTGTDDTTAPPHMARSIFDAHGAFATRGLINKKGCQHDEPESSTSAYNPKLPIYTVAWFKVYLDETPVWRGHDYHEMIYGSSKDSLCGGGDGEMETCTIHV